MVANLQCVLKVLDTRRQVTTTRVVHVHGESWSYAGNNVARFFTHTVYWDAISVNTSK